MLINWCAADTCYLVLCCCHYSRKWLDCCCCILFLLLLFLLSFSSSLFRSIITKNKKIKHCKKKKTKTAFTFKRQMIFYVALNFGFSLYFVDCITCVSLLKESRNIFFFPPSWVSHRQKYIKKRKRKLKIRCDEIKRGWGT